VERLRIFADKASNLSPHKSVIFEVPHIITKSKHVNTASINRPAALPRKVSWLTEIRTDHRKTSVGTVNAFETYLKVSPNTCFLPLLQSLTDI